MTNEIKPWVFGAKDQRHRGVEVVEGEGGKLLTVTEAIKQGGLDWAVELRDPVTNDIDKVEAEGWKQVIKCEATVEDGKDVIAKRTLGMVKGRYTVLQNRAAFTFFDQATMEGAAIIKAVGHLDHGRVVWAVAQRPDSMELLPGDVVSQNMILLTAHDGSHAVKVMFNAYRGATGTMLGFKGASKMRTEMRIRHTKSIDARMRTLHNILDAETGYFQRWRTALVGDETKGVRGFKQRIVTQDEINRVVDNLFPAKPKLDEDGKTFTEVSGKAEKARELIHDRIEKQAEKAAEAYEKAGQNGPQGVTALDVFLGVAEYVGQDRKAKNEGNNWVVSTFGSGAAMRQKAFDLIAGL